MNVPELEKQLGIEVYGSRYPGMGGKIRQFVEDFVVEEILTNGSKATVALVKVKNKVALEKKRYLICVLVKRGWDNLLAVKELARRLSVSSRHIQIAGLKDAQAITAQHVSIRNITAEHVEHVKIRDIDLQALCYVDKPLSSSLLFGNHFHIVVRDIAYAPPVIEKHVKVIQNELSSLGGIPNFFGHQRFGTVRPITHLVGKALAKGKLEEAAMIFLAKPSAHEHPESREARQRLEETRDFEEALRLFPSSLKYERLMLSHLIKQPHDFAGAFRRLPKKLCRLFLQAYQSYLFNRFLSQRILRNIPLNEPQTGDYIVSLNSHGLPTSTCLRITKQPSQNIQEKVKKGEMCIAVPIIGFRQRTSNGIQGEIEREILELENITPENFYVPSMPEISAPGGLRTVLTPIINFLAKPPAEDYANPSRYMITFSFTMRRGSYATIFLREFMKPKDPLKAGF